MKTLAKKVLRTIGWDIVSFDPRFNFEAKKRQLLLEKQINQILDVGANAGQFGNYLRSIGYSGEIISFEPMVEAYLTLLDVTDNDPKWKSRNLALGSQVGEIEINISRNSYSSSINEVLPNHLKSHPDSEIIGHETVQISTIDSLFKEFYKTDSHVLLKVDTQGYESNVLEGAKNSLKNIDMVILEMSVEPLYAKQELLPQLLEKMSDAGFSLAGLEPCDEDYDSYRILQMDGWFIRKN